MFSIPENHPFADDLDVQLDASTYVAPALPQPIDDGRYGFRIDPGTMSLRTDKDGKVIYQDDKYPIVTIGKVEVVEGVERPRTQNLYQDVRTKPFTRRDPVTGDNVPASALADLILSADPTASFRGVEEGLRVLQGLVAQSAVFHARLRWTATDVKAAKAEADAIKANADDPTSDETRKAVNEVWKKYRVQGQKNFNGKPYIDAADGDSIDARVEIPMDGFIAAADLSRVKLGPTFKRPQPVAA